MEEAEQQNLFDVKLSATGRYYIRRFAVLARIIILFGLIISGIHIASTVIAYVKFDPNLLKKYKLLVLQNKISPYYTFVYCLLFYPQMYFYWQVTRYLKKGLIYNDEETFNKAFHSLFRFSVFGLGSIVLSLGAYVLELLIFIKEY